MIVKKLDDGSYFAESKGDIVKVLSKKKYLSIKEEILSRKEPSDEELIALGKEFHEYYRKDNDLVNVENNLKEIDEFEKKEK